MNTFQTYWEEMEALARAGNKPEAEIALMRNGFYVGAVTSVTLTTRIGAKLLTDELSIEAAMAMMQGLREELTDYFEPFFEKEKKQGPPTPPN